MTTVDQRRRRIGWGIGLAFAGAVVGMVIGWLVAAQLEGERDAAQRNAQEQKVTADSALNYMRSACSAGDPVACDYVDKLKAVPDPPTPAAGPAGPVGPVGAAGRDGRDGVDGRDGRPGKAGRDGADGADGDTGAEGAAGRDGQNGKDGAPGKDGRDGVDGVDGKDGAPGRSLDHLECVDGQLVSIFTDGTSAPVAGAPVPNPVCVPRNPTPGGTP